MKTLAFFVAASALLVFSMTVSAWDLSWQNAEPLRDYNGVLLDPGCMVQLIVDGGNGEIDDPLEWIMSQADPSTALDEWIAGGCLPVGDDYLLDASGQNPTYIMDFGDPAYNGYFGEFNITGDLPDGTRMYTRYFFTPDFSYEWVPMIGYMMYADWGSGDGTQDFYVLDTGPSGSFAYYILIPEPTSVAMILGGGLIMAHRGRRRRKKA